jgi:fluoroacetyl-CoA thioesterase
LKEEAMGVLDNVAIGMTAETTTTVSPEMTVGHFVADMPPVYATPMMILHMEMASGAAIASHLPEGFVSVGMDVKVHHLAATPVGRTVRAIARVLKSTARALYSRSKPGTATARSVTAPIAAASSMWWSSRSGSA